RLDRLLVEQGLAPSRERAQSLILAGLVTVKGQRADKAGTAYPPDAKIAVKEDPCPYVSRGGLKLAHALDTFELSPEGRICIDVGSSTGGFTDVMLQRGARRVVCVDVGKGQLDWKLRDDDRVAVLEGVNARNLTKNDFTAAAGKQAPTLATADLSFISVTKVLPAIRPLMAKSFEMLILAKPQFEVGKGQVGKGGIVKAPAVHRAVLESLWGWAEENNFGPAAACASPIRGAKGNREFFLHLIPGEEAGDMADEIERALVEKEDD
ncbi:MAG: TlyA family RNA methyltransferase, partial [Nitrospinaceae bacterium]|nr:TlyA family RNA methyltransferase [Nitrospinaceae bacterium]